MTDVNDLYDDVGYDPSDDIQEPTCGACMDRGCRACQPTRLQVAWWHATAPLRRIVRRARFGDEAPF